MIIRRLLFPTLGILPLIAVGILSGAAQAVPAHAKAISGGAARNHSLVAATTLPESEASTTSLNSQNIVGIVKSVNGSQVEVKLPDGTSQFFNAPPSFAASTLDRGSFVEVNLDAQKSIKEIKIPSVSKVISGVISKINSETGDVTLELANGTQETTVINPQTIERMNLAAGVPLTVTSYTGLEATKLCPTLLATCCQRPTAPLPPPYTPPAVLPRERVVPQKW